MKTNRFVFLIAALFFTFAIASYGCSKKAVKEEESMGSAKKEEVKSGVPAERPMRKEEPMAASKPEKMPGSMPSVEPKPDKMPRPETRDELTVLVEKESKLFTIYFDFDKFSIRDDMKPALERNAEWLKKNTAVKVKLEGHCDDRGSDEYNLALGDRRANSAKKYLANLGIDASRISTISYGEEKPVCKDASEPCWSKNRRVEFVITR